MTEMNSDRREPLALPPFIVRRSTGRIGSAPPSARSVNVRLVSAGSAGRSPHAHRLAIGDCTGVWAHVSGRGVVVDLLTDGEDSAVDVDDRGVRPCDHKVIFIKCLDCGCQHEMKKANGSSTAAKTEAKTSGTIAKVKAKEELIDTRRSKKLRVCIDLE